MLKLKTYREFAPEDVELDDGYQYGVSIWIGKYSQSEIKDGKVMTHSLGLSTPTLDGSFGAQEIKLQPKAKTDKLFNSVEEVLY